MRQTRPKVAADGAGTNDKNLHKSWMLGREPWVRMRAAFFAAAVWELLVMEWWMLEQALAMRGNRCRGAQEEGDR